jgi:prevent-host-death family protein
MPKTVGVREIRQRASELIRRAEGGEEIVVAVSGRPAARLVPLEAPGTVWRDVAGLAHVWESPTDPDWDSERRADQSVDQAATEPWMRGRA